MIKNKKYYLAKTKIQPNTFIGGVGTTINTAASVASKLGISVSRIKAFSVIGDNIQFAVTGGSYVMPNLCWVNNSAITYYDDKDGLVTSLLGQAFRNNIVFTYANFPAATSVAGFCFHEMPAALDIRLPICSSYSNSFNSMNINCVITTHLNNLTNGTSGKPNAALISANCLVTYIGYVDDGTWNTEIKGVAATDNTRLKIGRRIGCSPAALLNFQIVGSDIRFKVYGKYKLPLNCYNSRSDITAFNDNTDLVDSFALNGTIIAYCPNITSLTFNGVTSLGANNGSIFRSNSALTSLTMNNMTTCSSGWLCRDIGNNFTFNFANLVTYNASLAYGMSNIVAFYAPKLKHLGTSASSVEVFDTNLKLNACTVTVDRFMQTSNAGAEEGDIAYARNTRGATIVYIDN